MVDSAMTSGLFIIVALVGVAGMLLLPGSQILLGAVCGAIHGWSVTKFMVPRSVRKALFVALVLFPMYMIVLALVFAAYSA